MRKIFAVFCKIKLKIPVSGSVLFDRFFYFSIQPLHQDLEWVNKLEFSSFLSGRVLTAPCRLCLKIRLLSCFRPSSRSRDFADSKYLLHHAQFNSDVLPDSHRRPYLIKVTSEWCFACIHIEPVWKETVQELEPLGKSAVTRLPPVCPRTLSVSELVFLKVS